MDESLNAPLLLLIEPFILSYTVKERITFALSYMIFHVTLLVRACLSFYVESYQSDVCCFRAMTRDGCSISEWEDRGSV